MVRKFIKDERAEFAIDAIFGITFFMISLIALMFMSLIIRIQSNMQYALGQTAKEISGYYYLADKIGLAAVTSGSGGAQDVDSTINSVMDFMGSAEQSGKKLGESVGTVSNSSDVNAMVDEFIKFYDENEENAEELQKKAETMMQNIKGVTKDPKGQLRQLLSVFTKTFANGAVNKFIAPGLCEMVMPKYITSKEFSSIDEYYESIGIKDVSYLGSEFLSDKRSIKILVTYKLNLEKYTLGFVKGDITFRQTASTAAWIRPDGKNTVSLTEIK